ncbi:hypothetical protein PFISCL1PPCAC_4498, partial [Pristionchus fissidentatus]
WSHLPRSRRRSHAVLLLLRALRLLLLLQRLNKKKNQAEIQPDRQLRRYWMQRRRVSLPLSVAALLHSLRGEPHLRLRGRPRAHRRHSKEF